MNFRTAKPKPGMKGRVLLSQLDPAGSWTNLEVTVTEVAEGNVTVQDSGRRTATFRHWHVDVGSEVQVGDEWIHESDPRALDAIEQTLVRSDSMGPANHEMAVALVRYQELLRSILQRHGRPDTVHLLPKSPL
jgi:hypothetical protein